MKKIFNKFFLILICLSMFTGSMLLCGCDEKEENNNTPTATVLNLNKTLGVWWWDKSLGDEYLSFASLNGVEEIYYCDYSPEEDVYTFVKKANQRGIKVYLLLGEKEWLNDSSNLYAIINKYKTYQEVYPDAKLSGIHLDIEPHQFSDFKSSEQTRKEYITKLITLADNLVKANSEITFDFDIPFWLNDSIVFAGETKPAFKHLIDIANRVFVMSYRDSAEEIVNVANEEIEYAKSKNKQIFVSVEMSSSEGDNVSFQEESKQILNTELGKIEGVINYNNYGVSIHHIKSWKNLKDK